MAGLNRHERTSGSGRGGFVETDGLREQVLLLEELSQKLDEYFALR